jgi:hypothetical protein
MGTDGRWDELKGTIAEASEKELVSKRADMKTPWIMMEVRRKKKIQECQEC